MAAPQSRAAPPPPGSRQPGRQGRILGLPPWAVVVGIVVVAGGVVFYWVRQRRAAQATSTGTAATPAGSLQPVDWSGEIATLQTEIADLQSSMAEQEQDIGQEAAAQAEQEQDIAQDEREDRRTPPCPKGFVRNKAGRCVKAPARKPPPRRRPPRQKNPLPVDLPVPNPPHHNRRAA